MKQACHFFLQTISPYLASCIMFALFRNKVKSYGLKWNKDTQPSVPTRSLKGLESVVSSIKLENFF